MKTRFTIADDDAFKEVAADSRKKNTFQADADVSEFFGHEFGHRVHWAACQSAFDQDAYFDGRDFSDCGERLRIKKR